MSICAAILVLIFKGQVNAIIPLYAVGVFTSFTLSQAGMIRYWFKDKSINWHSSAMMNGLGAFATLIVLLVIISTKFLLGAWLVVIAIPLVVVLFAAINQHYQYVAQRLSIQELAPRSYISVPKPAIITHPAVVVVGQLNRGTIEALDYARTIADEIVAVHIDIGSTDREKLQEKWQNLESDIPLEIIDSPYRSVIRPIVDFVGEFQERHPDVFTTIIIPVFVPRNWWDNILHNQTTLFLKNALRVNKSRIVTTVSYYL